MTTNEEMKALRLAHNLTQEQFAKLLDVCLGTVKYWETDKRLVLPRMLKYAKRELERYAIDLK